MFKSFKKMLLEAVKNLQDFLQKNHNTHIGKNFNDVHTILHHMQDSYMGKPQKLEEHELNAVRSYTEESSTLNNGLLKYSGNKERAQEYHRDRKDNDHPEINIDHLDSALSKHTLPKMVVHSGVNFHPQKVTDKTSGVMKSSAYLSTTTNPEDARFFARPIYHNEEEFHRHILNIHVPQGHNGLYVGNRSMGSKMTHSDENEVLLPRGLKMKVKPEPVHSFVDEKTRDRFHVWEAHIIPHGEDPHTFDPDKKK